MLQNGYQLVLQHELKKRVSLFFFSFPIIYLQSALLIKANVVLQCLSMANSYDTCTHNSQMAVCKFGCNKNSVHKQYTKSFRNFYLMEEIYIQRGMQNKHKSYPETNWATCSAV